MLRFALGAVVVASCMSFTSAGVLADDSRPNVLFIAVDDLNHWVSYTGRNPQCKTPNIDRLSARGVSFTNAHCVVPACNPSRAALLSGQRPFKTGCYLNANKWKDHITEGLNLPSTFRKAGYFVAGAGKIHHSSLHYPSEWDLYADLGDKPHGVGVAKMEGFHKPLANDLKDQDLRDWQVVDFCIEQLQKERDQPFFLACGLNKPHLPFAVPRKYYDAYPVEGIELPPHKEDDLEDVPAAGKRMAKPRGDHQRFVQSGRWKAAIRAYLATVAYTDTNIGRLLDALDASPHAQNTMIVLWGDHGWHFGEKSHWRKFALWEEATRAPLIWVAPGVTPAGELCEAPVDFMTIYPTLCDLAGIEKPAHVEGRSVRSLLTNPEADWDGFALTTHGYENHAVRTDRFRYIRYANGEEELYDHQSDPYEWTNLAGDARFDAVKTELASRLPQQAVPAPD